MLGWGIQKWGSSPWGKGEQDNLYFNAPAVTITPVLRVATVTLDRLMLVISASLQTLANAVGITMALGSSAGNVSNTPALVVSSLSNGLLMTCKSIDAKPLK